MMRRSTARFSRYRLADHLITEPAPLQAAWLTGQSSYRQHHLSPAQIEVLDALSPLGYAPVKAGFPYNAAAMAHPYRHPWLIPAAIRCTEKFLAARSDSGFASEVARHLGPVVEHTSRRLILLCGSSGFELFAAALPSLTLPPEIEILAIGLGPVGRTPAVHPNVRVVAIKGRWDPYSHLGSRIPQDIRVPTGHLRYAHDPATREAVIALARDFAT